MNEFKKLNKYLNVPTNKEKSIKSDIRYILKNSHRRLSDNRLYTTSEFRQIETNEIYKYIMKNFEEKSK